ncbi:MAG: TldD/PmbA family protein [Thaumarchaeota archaeon]|nr:TldD/PmbA family protein [Nitrososphaerota archaeon]
MSLLEVCKLAEKIAVRAGADDVEAYASIDKEVEVFIERNDIKLGKVHTKSILGVRVFKNKSAGFTATNNLSAESVKDVSIRAVKMAKTAPAEKFNILPDKSKPRLLQGIYEKGAENFTVKEALERALLMLETAKDYDKRITVDSGTFNTAVSQNAIVNSNGIEVSEKISMFSWAIMGMAIKGNDISNFDYQTGGTHQVRNINVEKTAKDFAENVVGSLGAKRVESFKGFVVLSPEAVADVIVAPVESSANANLVQKGMSKFASKLAKEVASKDLTIIDDGTFVDGLAASSFDREGVPHKRLKIIENGVLRSYMYNTYTAAKDHVKSTGHAIGGGRTSPSVGPTNIIIEQGKEELNSIIKGIRKGILVTRFSGNVSSVSGDFSGVIKGGFLIQNGQKKHAIKETLMAGNVYTSLNNIHAISKERKLMGAMLLPYVCVHNISITAG